jgi:hypothetical protein
MAVFQLVQGSYNPFRASKAGNYMKLQEEKISIVTGDQVYRHI